MTTFAEHQSLSERVFLSLIQQGLQGGPQSCRGIKLSTANQLMSDHAAVADA